MLYKKNANSYFETTICKDTIKVLKEVLDASKKVGNVNNDETVSNNYSCGNYPKNGHNRKLENTLTLA